GQPAEQWERADDLAGWRRRDDVPVAHGGHRLQGLPHTEPDRRERLWIGDPLEDPEEHDREEPRQRDQDGRIPWAQPPPLLAAVCPTEHAVVYRPLSRHQLLSNPTRPRPTRARPTSTTSASAIFPPSRLSQSLKRLTRTAVVSGASVKPTSGTSSRTSMTRLTAMTVRTVSAVVRFCLAVVSSAAR